jgi:hypothetical protein
MIWSLPEKGGRRVLEKDRKAIRKMGIQTGQMQQVHSLDMLGHQKAEGFKAQKIGSLRKTMMK